MPQFISLSGAMMFPNANDPNMIMPYVLGGAAFGNAYKEISDDEVNAIVKTAYDKKIRAFDTAALYGHGLSEVRLAKALKKIPEYNREQCIISTKVGYVLKSSDVIDPGVFINPLPYQPIGDYTYTGVMLAVDDSLERLGTKYIDICYVHNLDKIMLGKNYQKHLNDFLKGGITALEQLKQAGMIKKIGLGVNEWDAAMTLFENGIKLDYIMLACHYTLAQQTAPEDFFHACALNGTRIITAGTLNSGILSGNPSQTTYNYQLASDSTKNRIDQIRSICEEKHHTPLLQAALQFPLLHPVVEAVAVGSYEADEVLQNIDCFLKPTPIELWHDLKKSNLMEESAFIPPLTFPEDNVAPRFYLYPQK